MLNTNVTRPVSVWRTKYKNVEGHISAQLIREDFLYNADFHCFSIQADLEETYPVALVEKEDGTVESVDIDQIIFLDKDEQK